jgi:hypothetical protein
MKNREVAMEFLKCFCAGDINGLVPLLAEDLQFTGPFHHFSSSNAYLDSLKNDPPEKCGYRVLSVTESGDSVSIYYDYEKSDGAITIAQLFTFKNQKIREILLVFDGRGFA